MQNISGVLYEYLQSVQAYIAPPITAVFLLGIFFKRINAKGAISTLVFGLVVAVIRITLELSKESLTPGSFAHTFGSINFLTFGVYFFLMCCCVAVLVSLLTEKPTDEQLEGLTFGTITEEQKLANKNSYNWKDIVASILIVILVIFIMISFTGEA